MDCRGHAPCKFFAESFSAYSDEAAPGAVSPENSVKARLKWFNNPKGFGFVVPENESIDAFLHISTLLRAGVLALGEGACLLCRIEHRPRGRAGHGGRGNAGRRGAARIPPGPHD